ncbi:MAG: sugar ABC transporter permease [Oscillospiraceae bacterium]
MQGNTRKKIKSVSYGKYGYLFIAPFFLSYFIFSFWPLVKTFWLSVQEYYWFGGSKKVRPGMIGPDFCGLDNFKSLIWNKIDKVYTFDTQAVESFKTTGSIWAVNFIPQILLALVLAVWLTDTKMKLKGQGAFKIMIYMPNIITAASVSFLFYSLFGNEGPITEMLRDAGLVARNFDFMLSATGTRGIISFILFWMWYGNTMLLIIAGILGINPSLFEAANIDGASGIKTFFRITLPMLKPIILFVLVTSAIGGLQMYDIPAMFNVDQVGNGGPDYKSTTVTMYIKLKAFGADKDMGVASAVSVILFLITLIISLVMFFFLGDKETPKVKKKKGLGVLR